jgi:hypothetical protein
VAYDATQVANFAAKVPDPDHATKVADDGAKAADYTAQVADDATQVVDDDAKMANYAAQVAG